MLLIGVVLIGQAFLPRKQVMDRSAAIDTVAEGSGDAPFVALRDLRNRGRHGFFWRTVLGGASLYALAELFTATLLGAGPFGDGSPTWPWKGGSGAVLVDHDRVWWLTIGLSDADAVVIVTALLALVAVLSVALTTSAWRPVGLEEGDEANVQLWTEDLAGVGAAAAAASVAVTLTRLPSPGYFVFLFVISMMTAVLGSASLQRSKDTVSLAIRRHEITQDIAGIGRVMESLDPIGPETTGYVRFVRAFGVGCLLSCAMAPLLLLFDRDSTESLVSGMAWSYLIILGWLLALMALYTPTMARWQWPRRTGLAAAVLLVAWLVWFLAQVWHEGVSWLVKAHVVAAVLVPMALAWGLVHLGRRNRWVGRGLFQLVQTTRWKRVKLLREAKEELDARLAQTPEAGVAGLASP